MAKRKGTHRFHSQKQWRWAFATRRSWARRHAHATPGGPVVRYRRLPVRISTRRGRRSR